MQYMLFFPQHVDRNQTISAQNGKKFFLLDIIAHILHHLKDELLKELRDINLKASDFNWVITIPAIWKPDGEKMMREAGYLVSF